MGCYLQYGSYRHDMNATSFTVAKNVTMNEAQQPYAETITWTIQGTVGSEGDTPAVVAAKFYQLEVAYAFWGRDLIFCDDSGNVLQQLRSAGSLTGTRVMQPPACPQGEGAEFVGYRNFTIVVSAEYPMTGSFGGKVLRDFRESISFSGGGPRRAIVECVNMLPQEQVLALYTTFRATQDGSAVGVYGYPLVPPPVFGENMLEEAPSVTLGGPRMSNGILTDFSISWSYRFISALPLSGEPNAWLS